MFKKLIWILRGKPTIEYPGYNCGCCGLWYDEPFKVASLTIKGNIVYKKGDLIGSSDFDTWGLCPKGKGCNKL